MGEIADDHEDEFLSGDYVRSPRYMHHRTEREFTVLVRDRVNQGGISCEMTGRAEVRAYTPHDALRRVRRVFPSAFLEVLS